MADYDYFDPDPCKPCITGNRKIGDERTKRNIARKMKVSGMFSLEYIANLCELELKTVERLKADIK